MRYGMWDIDIGYEIWDMRYEIWEIRYGIWVTRCVM
jgi:hypothetical protein